VLGARAGASSTTSTWWSARRLPPRRCSASARCTRSSATSAGSLPAQRAPRFGGSVRALPRRVCTTWPRPPPADAVGEVGPGPGAIKYALGALAGAPPATATTGRIEIDKQTRGEAFDPAGGPWAAPITYSLARTPGGERQPCSLQPDPEPRSSTTAIRTCTCANVLERIAEHPIHRVGRTAPWRVTLEMPAQRCA